MLKSIERFRARLKIYQLVVVFAVSFIGLSTLYYITIEKYTLYRAKSLVENELLLTKSIQHYIETIQRPELYRLQEEGQISKEYFSPKILSRTYFTRKTMEILNKEREASGLDRVFYKISAKNPRNSVNQASKEDLELLKKMNNGLKKYSSIIEKDGEKFFYEALPVSKNTKSCLRCHGDPKDAPLELVDHYGDKLGFNENVGEIRAFASLTVPMKNFILEAEKIWFILTTVTFFVLAIIFSIIFIFIKKLRNINKALEQETIRAHVASQAKSDFISTISHEIRNPLGIIIGVIDLMQYDRDKIPTRRHVEILSRNSKSLAALINDILDFNKMEVDEIAIENIDFNLKECVVQLVENMSILSRPKGTNIVLTYLLLEDMYVGDKNRIQQILINLIGNAVKFSHQGGKIEVIIKQNPASPDQVLFSVKDFGIGIEKDLQKKIFKPFVQAKSETTRKFGGTGLGLAISNKLIKLMGGELKLESEQDKGSRFFFMIPLKSILSKFLKISQTKLAKSSKEQKKSSVLIVDDSEDNIFLLQLLLRDMPYDICCASNGNEAFQKYCENKFDIVLMDMRMEVLDGIEATKKIRDYEVLKSARKVPIIALTANSTKDEKIQSVKAGCDYYITKPIDKNLLLKTMQEASLLYIQES